MKTKLYDFFQKNTFFIFCVLSWLLVFYVRWRHFDIAFERDEGEYAYAGQAILRGELPYKDFYNMKMPVVYYTYALAFWLGGSSYQSVKVILLIYNALTAIFVFLIAKKLFDKSIAWLSAGVFGLLSLTFSAQGWTANSEHFVTLPAMMGFYALLRGGEQKRWQEIWFLLSGILLGCSAVTKQHALIYLLFPLFFLFSIKNLKLYLLKLIYIGIGFLIVIFSIGLYFYSKGIFERFYFLTVQYAAAYIGSESNYLSNLNNFIPIFRETIPFWIICIGALIATLLRPNMTSKRGILWLFLIISFLIVSPGGFYRPHYFQLAFPLLALPIGFGLARFSTWRKPLIIFPLICLIYYNIAQTKYLFSKNSTYILDKMYQVEHFTQLKELGEKLPQLLPSDATLGMLGSEPQVAFYANRKLASGFLYHYPLVENQPFAPQMAQQFIQEIEAAKPTIFLYMTSVKSIQPLPNIKIVLNTLETWKQTFIQNYEVVGKIYAWNSHRAELRLLTEGGDLSSEDNVFLYIYQRKN